MKQSFNTNLPLASVLLAMTLALPVSAAPLTWGVETSLTTEATHERQPERATQLGAARAGDRVVAVGDFGVVLLRDPADSGYRQASRVPTRATLTAVHFVDADHGWAVGHLGTVLRTRDGGENWERQRGAVDLDPLFSVWFADTEHGFASGRFATLLETRDGGVTWANVELPESVTNDEPHFYALFPGSEGSLYIAAEMGIVLRNRGGDAAWERLDTGYGGSFWTGTSLRSGTLVAAGMVGTIYRSADGGDTWEEALVETRASFTDITEIADGKVVAVGLDGVIAVSENDGRLFTVDHQPERLPLTAVIGRHDEGYALFSKTGAVK